MVNPTNIHDISLEELSGVISVYPWFAGARIELCRRMADEGALSESQIAETALHLCDRKVVTPLLRRGREVDLSDKDAVFVPKIAIKPLAFGTPDPAVIPRAPSLLGKGDRAAPGAVICHCFRIRKQNLLEPEILQFRPAACDHPAAPPD